MIYQYIVVHRVVDSVLIKQLFKALGLIHCVLYGSTSNPNTQQYNWVYLNYLWYARVFVFYFCSLFTNCGPHPHPTPSPSFPNSFHPSANYCTVSIVVIIYLNMYGTKFNIILNFFFTYSVLR